jgi:hypothetical protein
VNNGNRNEYRYDVATGATWRLDKQWSVRLANYSYDRTDVSLTIRRDFR